MYVNTHVPVAFCCRQSGGNTQHAGHFIPFDNAQSAAAYRSHLIRLVREKQSTA